MAPLNRQGLTAFSELLQQLYAATAVSFAEHLHQVLAQHFFYDLFRYEEPELTVSRHHPDNQNCTLETNRSGTKNRLGRPNRRLDADNAPGGTMPSSIEAENIFASQVQPRRFETVISLAGEAEARLRITLTRFNRDFSRSERAWMDLLKPHLGQLYRATRAADRAAITAGPPWERAFTERTIENPWGKVGSQGREVKPSQTGGLRLTRALGPALTEPRPSGTAPLNHAGSNDPLFTASAASQNSAAPTALPPAIPSVLQRLGLTVREAEVLLWVSRGKTNDEIAIILNISSRTVGKHMEHIASKLNVETRTSAAAIALEMLALSSLRGSHSFLPFTRTAYR
jgi:DNA-binding CsgD family transcriptional regulator